MNITIRYDDGIHVQITADALAYEMAAVNDPSGERLVDAAPWGTTPLMDRLHVCLVQLHEGIRPQIQASISTTIATGLDSPRST